MVQFIGFLKNTATRDEFVAAVEADDRAEAHMMLEADYPAPAYALHTIYTRTELTNALSSIDRWPGLPSKVQPKQQPLETLLARVTAHQGGLPPLPTAATSVARPVMPEADGGKVAEIQSFVSAQSSPELQAMAARLAGAAVQPREAAKAVAPKAAAAVPPASAIAAIKAMQNAKMGAQPALQAAAPMAPVAKTAAKPISAAAKGSLIDVLKAMKK